MREKTKLTMVVRGIIVLYFLTYYMADCNKWCEDEYDCYNLMKGGRFKHTMCRYKEGGDPECQNRIRGLSKEEKDMILDFHNRMRQKVANGQELRGLPGPQPTAADMMEVHWDEEVATIAQRWAEQCLYQGHDGCRRTLDCEHIGQNFGWIGGYGYPQVDRMGKINDILKRWYDEVGDFYTEFVDSFQSNPGLSMNQQYGHYTAMVWAKTTRVGCGILHKDGHQFDFRIVCNYKSGGNILNQPVYTKGGPASLCPGGSVSTKYNGLCDSKPGETPKSIKTGAKWLINPAPVKHGNPAIVINTKPTAQQPQKTSWFNFDPPGMLPFISKLPKFSNPSQKQQPPKQKPSQQTFPFSQQPQQPQKPEIPIPFFISKLQEAQNPFQTILSSGPRSGVMTGSDPFNQQTGWQVTERVASSPFVNSRDLGQSRQHFQDAFERRAQQMQDQMTAQMIWTRGVMESHRHQALGGGFRPVWGSSNFAGYDSRPRKVIPVPISGSKK